MERVVRIAREELDDIYDHLLENCNILSEYPVKISDTSLNYTPMVVWIGYNRLDRENWEDGEDVSFSDGELTLLAKANIILPSDTPDKYCICEPDIYIRNAHVISIQIASVTFVA